MNIAPPETVYNSGEDDGDEAKGVVIMNLHHNQLGQMRELELLDTASDNDEFDDDDDGDEEPELFPEAPDVPNVVVHASKKFAYTGPKMSMPCVLHLHDKFKWVQDEKTNARPIFPEANYLDCAMTRHQAFDKLFNADVLQMIVDRSNAYAILQDYN